MVRKYDGNDLARVLSFYGLIEDVSTTDFNICCPFHDDLNPSMRVTLDNGIFYCFVCNLQGNAFDFVQLVNPELNELEICMLLEKIVHNKKVKHVNIKYVRKKKKNNKCALLEAKHYYYGLKEINWEDKSKIGDEEKEVIEYMQKRGYSKKMLNIGKCRVNYNLSYPFIFPILDNGIFKGWVGRATDKKVEQYRKYLYNDGFLKRDTLCGDYKRGCLLFVCEGFFDYLSLRVKGDVKNVAALLGWHLSEGQLEKLRKEGIKYVVSALDNDECGEKGTKVLNQHFKVVRFKYPKKKKIVAK